MSGSKLIYLARRNPRLSREQFMRRWRQHAAFSMGLARWSAIQRCAYCDVLPPSLGIPWAVEGYDGVADIWFRGDATPADPEDRARLSADEIETFSDYVSAFALHTREVIVKPGGGTVKATLFVRNTASGGPGGFAARWARHADRVLSLPRADLVAATRGTPRTGRGNGAMRSCLLTAWPSTGSRPSRESASSLPTRRCGRCTPAASSDTARTARTCSW